MSVIILLSVEKHEFFLNDIQSSCITSKSWGKLHQNMEIDDGCKIIAIVGLKQIWCVHLMASKGNRTFYMSNFAHKWKWSYQYYL